MPARAGMTCFPPAGPTARKAPSVPHGTEDAVPLSEKAEKKRKGYRKGEKNGPERKSQKDKGQKQRHEHVTNYSPDKDKNYENRTYRKIITSYDNFSYHK